MENIQIPDMETIKRSNERLRQILEQKTKECNIVLERNNKFEAANVKLKSIIDTVFKDLNRCKDEWIKNVTRIHMLETRVENCLRDLARFEEMAKQMFSDVPDVLLSTDANHDVKSVKGELEALIAEDLKLTKELDDLREHMRDVRINYVNDVWK